MKNFYLLNIITKLYKIQYKVLEIITNLLIKIIKI